VFTNPLLPLFSPHPLLQSLGVFTLVQAILVLQPTNTSETKVLGARAHASLNLLSFLIFVSGVTIIETNKEKSGSPHFHSAHGYLGVITAAVLLIQYIFGFLIWGVPRVFGGVDNAKALWKYHRWSGYVLLLLILVTVVSAVDTTYNHNVLDIKLWAMLVSVILIVVGIYPRIQLTKLGIHRA
jgi:cytochrome b-561